MTYTINKVLVAAGFFLISSALTILSPDTYSFGYCLGLFTLFIVSSLWFLKTIYDGEYFTFHFLFLISFLFVNYIYPVFIYPVNKTYFPVYKYAFNEEIITSATSIASLGIISYFLGAVLIGEKTRNKTDKDYFSVRSVQSIIFILVVISFLFFLILMIIFWEGIILGQFGSTGESNQYILALFQITFEMAIIFEFINLRRKAIRNVWQFILHFNKYLLFIGFLFTILFFRVGDRGPVIQLTLLSIALYSMLISRINLRKFAILLVFGMFVLTFISYARTKSNQELKEGNTFSSFIKRGSEKMSINVFYDLGMDLIINNRNLYVGLDYAKTNGFTYGKNMFIFIFAPIPKLPTIMAKLIFDSTPTKLSSDYIITIETLGPDATWRVGSNIISDVYMSFGVIGVVFFMFFLGYFIQNLQSNIYTRTNVINLIVYMIMLSFSIYMPRAPYFTPLRFILWSIIIYWFIRELTSSIIERQNKQINA